MAFSDETYGVLMKKIKSTITGIGDVRINSSGTGLVFENKFDSSTFEVILPGFHTHSNLSSILEKFTKDSNGNLLFDGEQIVTYEDLVAGKNIKIEKDATTGKIKISSTGGSGSGGSAVLSSDLTSNVEVGGVPKNKTYAKDTQLETIVRDILIKYIEPTVALSINPNKTVYKKGDTLNPLDIKATVTKNSNDIVSIKYYVDTTLVDTKDSSTDPTLPTGGTFTYQYTTDITTDSTIKIVVNDSTKDVTKTVKIIFVNPYYVGASATNVVTSTTGLTETVEDKGDKTINYVCNNEYAVFMYPSSYGNITTILDENGFNCTTDFTLSTTTIDSVSYNVYVSNNPLTTSGFRYSFKL